MSDLEKELTATLNRHSAENASNTPDWILAQYLLSCLEAWNTAVQQREGWYGRDPRPTLATAPRGEPAAPQEDACRRCGHAPHDGKCRKQVMDLSVGYDKMLQCGCPAPREEPADG